MIKNQQPIALCNSCNAIYDEKELSAAILWYASPRPVYRKRLVYMHGKYPAVSVYDQKIHIHRLLMMYWHQADIDRQTIVHHKNHNRLDASRDNLEFQSAAYHGHIHNTGKTLSAAHKAKIAEANKKRKGMKMRKRIEMPNLEQYVRDGLSINKIAKIYGCDWSTVKCRIHENPELLEAK